MTSSSSWCSPYERDRKGDERNGSASPMLQAIEVAQLAALDPCIWELRCARASRMGHALLLVDMLAQCLLRHGCSYLGRFARSSKAFLETSRSLVRCTSEHHPLG